MRRLALALLLPLLLAACGADHIYASDAEVARARYVSHEPPSITLFTVVSKRSGAGAHSGIMIDGSERILFDPAGTWYHPTVPERNDVHFGITPRMRLFYIDYHARETYDVYEQKVPVSAAVANLAIQRAENYGPVNKSLCASSVSTILHDLPGFESIPHTLMPNKIRAAMSQIPGVVETKHEDGDPADHSGVLMIEASES